MVDAVVWFLVLEALGAAALPWAFVLFRFLPDRGLTLVKPLALLVLSYAVWVLGLTHILPNTQLTIWAAFLCVAVASVWLVGRIWEDLRTFFRAHWPVLLVGEVIFIGMFVAWALVASGSPGITHTEKPMDFMLLNAAYQARFFPAEDAWLSGHSISYYYFGHIIMALLSKMSGVVTSVGYNLALATLPALAGAAAFGLLYNLVRLAGGSRRWAIGVGAMAPTMLLLLGNLVGTLEFVRIRGWGGQGLWDWIAISGLNTGGTEGGAFPSDFWWWFRATRVIGDSPGGDVLDYTITEFPAFSFLLGDLHAHVLAIPFLLLAIASALNIYCSPGRLGFGWLREHAPFAVLTALAGGALAFTNFWDFPTFMALLAAALMLKAYRDYPESLLQAAQCCRIGIPSPVPAVRGDVRPGLFQFQRSDIWRTTPAGHFHPAIPPVPRNGLVHSHVPGLTGKPSDSASPSPSRGRLHGSDSRSGGLHPARALDGLRLSVCPCHRGCGCGPG